MSPGDDVVARLRAAGCVFAEEEADLLLEAAASDPGTGLETLLARRVAGEPLEHVLGWVDFAGERWSVGPGVFVPRRRTELMVRTALRELSKPRDPGGSPTSASSTVVVDLCCGCGAVGGAVLRGLRGLGDVTLHASDVDPAATAHARHNLEAWGAEVHTGDLFDPLPDELRGRVAALLCNAPYVPSAAIATMPPEAREHEPPVALDGGADGLDVLRRVAAAAPGWLAPGGCLIFEVSGAQTSAAVTLATSAGLRAVVVRDAPQDDHPTGGTVVVARRR